MVGETTPRGGLAPFVTLWRHNKSFVARLESLRLNSVLGELTVLPFDVCNITQPDLSASFFFKFRFNCANFLLNSNNYP